MELDYKFAIKIEGVIASINKADVQEIRVSDDTGYEADTMSIKLNAINYEVPIGKIAQIFLGIDELDDFGKYTIDEVRFNINDKSYTISGKSADMLSSLKQKRGRVFKATKKDETTIGEIIETIAKENKLKACISDDIKNAVVGITIQNNESDMHYITRICKDRFDAIVKIYGDKLIVVRRGDSMSAAGQKLPKVKLVKRDINSGDISLKERDKWESVTVKWRDDSTHKEIVVYHPSKKEPSYLILQKFKTKASALECAKATLRNITMNSYMLRAQIVGNSDLRAERILTFDTDIIELSGEWLITKADHTMRNNSYIVDIECLKKVET